MLVIAVVLDPYKLHLVNYYYMKIYGVIESVEFVNVRDKLSNLYMEYNTSSTTSSSTVVDPQGQEHHQELDCEKVNIIIFLSC